VVISRADAQAWDATLDAYELRLEDMALVDYDEDFENAGEVESGG
jgi:hypothetical protein